ncbi:methyltransferase [Pseudooceanicola sp.]|uniref:methyltransferase n=1 Tax=Pseudooceanicola sp. TaxID=1914328 RepID=UPI0035C6C6F1
MTSDALIPRPNPLLLRLGRLYHRVAHPIYQRLLKRPGLVTCDELKLATLPTVFHPVIMRAGVMLGRAAAKVGPPAAPDRNRALDMGCGSGIVGLFMARQGYDTVCVDLSADAVRLTRANALLNGLDQRMDVREGDLFLPVAGETFDLICFAPPYYSAPPNGTDLVGAFWSEGILSRFATDLPKFLHPDGIALVHLSTTGDSQGFLTPAKAVGFVITVHSRKVYLNEIMTVYALRLGSTVDHP